MESTDSMIGTLVNPCTLNYFRSAIRFHIRWDLPYEDDMWLTVGDSFLQGLRTKGRKDHTTRNNGTV